MADIRLGIIVSEFNESITQKMLERALEHARSLNVDVKYIFYVPGTYDMPIAVEKVLQKDVDAVVTLGAVIKGATRHDEIVASNAARLIADLSLKYGKPVTLGISGPGMTREEAEERINVSSIRAVEAAVKLVKRLKMLEEDKMIIR
ncbi:MAG: 6,7-dimethyl-8-ribityllumazine synthase [Candidatus Nitrosocaldaceae archaeon]